MKKLLIIATAPLWLPVVAIFIAVAGMKSIPDGLSSIGQPVPHR